MIIKIRKLFPFLVLFYATTLPASAQFVLEKETEIGRFFGGVSLGKSTDIGTFDNYVAPIIANKLRAYLHISSGSASQGGAGGVNQISSLIHNSAGNLQYRYAGNAGLGAIIGHEFSSLLALKKRGLRFYIIGYFERNAAKFFAPNGIGVLSEPTHFAAIASIRNLSINFEAPVHVLGTSKYDFYSFLGAGIIQNKTRSNARAESAFLDINISEQRTLIRPIFSYSLKMLSAEKSGQIGYEVNLKTYHTSKMYNAVLTMSSNIPF
jgi:hypothetical protein